MMLRGSGSNAASAVAAMRRSSSTSCTRRCMSTASTSSPSSRAVRVTYTSPVLGDASPSMTAMTTTTLPRSLPATAAAARTATSSASSLPPPSHRPRRMRFTNGPPPRSGWCSRVYPISLGIGLGTGMAVFSLLRDPVVHADAGPELANHPPPTIICLTGFPSTGKSLHAQRLCERFEGFRVVVVDDIISDDPLPGVREAVMDDWPRTLQQAQDFERDSKRDIFVLLYYDMPEEEFNKRRRDAGSADEYRQRRQELEPLVKEFRKRGNILEISAQWPDVEEVWEQVEAKVEQVLELRDRGERVRVE